MPSRFGADNSAVVTTTDFLAEFLKIFICLVTVFVVLSPTRCWAQTQVTDLRFVPVTPCRIADTRNANGPFGGPFLGGGTTRSFPIPSSTCNIPANAQAYSLNATVVPHGILGFLTMYPSCAQSLPLVSTLNSDGRIKAGAAIVPAGPNGEICAFASDATDLILDIDGYFVSATNTSALAFYPLTPCRVVDTRGPTSSLGGPSLLGNVTRNFPILSSSCNIPSVAQAYSLNFTTVPNGKLDFLTTWPAGQSQPLVSTLNAPTGRVTANAAIVPAGTNGDISVFVTNSSDLVIDINGYFAPANAAGLSLFTQPPCRVLDTRIPAGTLPFSNTRSVDVAGSGCNAPASAQAYILNATVVPPGPLGFLTLWPQGATQPLVSTLNAGDGAITSNMAIVPSANGSISAFAADPSHLVVDISGYFGPPPVPVSITSVSVSCTSSSIAVGDTNQCNATVHGTGNFNPAVAWSVNGIRGGNSILGTVSGTGLYTAPANVPSPSSITVTATSMADSSKSAGVGLTVNLKITLSPANPNIQIFHSQQFTATVSGVANTAVQWSVNGISGGDSTVGMIDSTGLYTAPIAVPPSPTIQVQAVSVADATQSATTQAVLIPDTIPPQVISVTPANLATNVALQPSIQITFDARMDPTSIPGGFSLLQGTVPVPATIGYDPSNSTVTLSLQGLLATSTTYTITVAGTVRDQSGNPMTAPFSSSFTTTGSAAVPSALVAPPGVDPSSMTVISLQGQSTAPDTNGNFSASVRPQGTTILAGMVPGEAFGLFAVSIGGPGSAASTAPTTAKMVGNTVVYSSPWQITASPTLALAAQPMVLDFQTTAESLLFLSPALFHGNAAHAQRIMTAIAAEPKTVSVATALQAIWNTPFPLEDPTFVSAYSDALRSILITLSQTPPPSATPSPLAQNSSAANTLAAAIAAASTNATVYHPFDICCISIDALALQGINYVAPIKVAGPTLSNPLGHASGWLVRVVQLPANFDPTTITPGVDPQGNADSPAVTPNEGQDPITTTLWIDGDSLFDYTDLWNLVGTAIGGFLGSITGIDITGNQTLTLPQPPPGTSKSYLIRAYSGGIADLNEQNLIANLPGGTDLWLRARLANDITAFYDFVNATGFIPSGILTCLAEKGVQDQVLLPLLDPSSSAYIGGAGAWNGFVSASVTIVTDFKNHFLECAASAGLGDIFEMLLSIAKISSIVGDLVDVVDVVDDVGQVSSAGHAIQIITEMKRTDSPVDTAYVTVSNNAIPPVLGVTISPANPTINASGQRLFSAVARDAFGNVIPNAAINWTSTNTSIVRIDNAGLATGIAAGQARITATASTTGASASTTVTVSAPFLDHLNIAPGNATLHVGQNAQFNVFGISNTGNPISLGPINWTTSPAGIVSVSTAGLVTALQVGSAFVNADSGGKSVAATISVIAASPAQIIVTPANSTVNVGSPFSLSAKAVDSSGNPIAGISFSWSTNASNVATVDPTGVVHALAAGQATITATAGAQSGSGSVTVLVGSSQLSLSGNSDCPSGSPQVHLQWNIINANSYDVYRENVLLVPNIVANTLNESVNLVPGTTYDYFVKAHLTAGGTLNSNISPVAVPSTCPGASGAIKVFPGSFNPVFTVGNAPATLGFQISNGAAGPLTGAIAANPIGGQWLTVDGHTTSNWVAPEGVNVTADPTGLAPGIYHGSLTVSSAGATNSPLNIPVQMTIYPPLQITTTSVPVAFSDQPYSATLNATGGSGTGFAWSLQSGTLPDGLTLNPTTGVISGTPGSISGTTVNNVNIGVQDSAGHFTFTTLAITWKQSLSIFTFAPSNFQFIVGTPYTNGNSITFQVAGGTPPYTWSATGLPPGLSIVASTGLITGTPTQPGTFQAHIAVSDNGGLSATSVVSLTVVTIPLRIGGSSGQSPPNLVTGSIGVSYSQVMIGIGGSQSGYTWSVIGSLPPGLTSGPSLGCPSSCGLLISGTPSQAGVFTFTAVVTDSLGSTAQQSVTIVVNTGTPPQITITPLTLAVTGQPYTFSFAATGGTAPYAWSMIGSKPDPGIAISNTGVLSGTTSLPNDCSTGPALWLSAGPSVFFQVLVTDAAGQSNVHQFCLPSYFPDPQITSLSPPSVIVDGQSHLITVTGSNFRNNAFVNIGGAVGTTFVNGTTLTFTLTPSTFGAFDPGGGGVISEGSTSLIVLEPYAHASNSVNLLVFDPVPTITSVSAVLNNSTNPCTANLSCQLVIQGSGLVFVTGYHIVETNTNLIRSVNPQTPIPWNTVTTSAFSISTPGTYTVTVTNPNQPNGGSATATAQFTVK